MATAYGYGGSVMLLTWTAPGQNLLPYDPWLDVRDGFRQVDRHLAKAWNQTASKRFSARWRKAQQATKRKTGGPMVWLNKSMAMQKRGVIHGHIAMCTETALLRWRAEVFAEEFRKRGAAHGFGHDQFDGWEIDGKKVKTLAANRAAGYVCKYVMKDGAGGRPEVLETVLHQDMRRERVLMNRPGLSPWTMAALRRVRLAYVLVRLCLGLVDVKVRQWCETPDQMEEMIEWIIEHADPPPTDLTKARTHVQSGSSCARARDFVDRFVLGVRPPVRLQLNEDEGSFSLPY